VRPYLRVARLELQDGKTTLGFDATSQQLYSVDFKASMNDNWIPIAIDQPGTSSWQVITLPATNVSGFYRIRSRPLE
jgi:hypothetical protein